MWRSVSLTGILLLAAAVVRADTLVHKETGEKFTGKVCDAKINNLTLVLMVDGERKYLDLRKYTVIDDDLGEKEAEAAQEQQAEDETAEETAEPEPPPEEEVEPVPEGEGAGGELENKAGAPEEDAKPGDPDGVAEDEPDSPAKEFKTVDIEITEDVTMSFARIPPGRFDMGSARNEEGRDDDELQHPVIISRGFLMSTTEVTQAQFQAVMGNNPSRFRDEGGEKPVHSVSWLVADEFCKKLTERCKMHFRLPTEAEWEYAARVGARGPYGGTGRLEDMGWTGFPRGGHAPSLRRSPTQWGFTICMATSGSGVVIGTQSIQKDQ